MRFYLRNPEVSKVYLITHLCLQNSRVSKEIHLKNIKTFRDLRVDFTHDNKPRLWTADSSICSKIERGTECGVKYGC